MKNASEKEKGVKKKDAKGKVVAGKEDPIEEQSIEQKLLHEAEEREIERKEQEEAEKLEHKKEAKEKEKAEREEHKSSKKKQIRKKPRHGKKYQEKAAMIEKDKEYPMSDAINLALQTSPAKFDATVEIHVSFGPKEKNLRGTVNLPGGAAKEKRILAVTEKNIDDVLVKIKANKIDFDVMVADLKVMPKLAPMAKTLGPKGLMPSPKAGTAVEDVEKTITEMKGGRVEYRADKTNVVHLAVGKVSFGPERVAQNVQALLGHLPKKIETLYLTTSMGPSVKVAKK